MAIKPVRNPQHATMKTFLTLIAILLSLSASLSANGGTIRTAITTTQTVKDSGTIELEFKIRNSGNATAHNVLVTLILADLVKSYRDLGDNLPGGEMTLKERLVNPGLNPGKYVAVLRVDFEEQNAIPHRAYHFFNIPYRLNKISSLNSPLSFKLDTPWFNRKAFWDKESKIKLTMKNNGKKALKPNIWLFLPDGFTSPEPNRSCRLTPGETKFEEIPLHLEPDGKNLSPYHLIVWYDKDNAHYSRHLKGIIKVEKQPVYFNWYLILGAILLIIFFTTLSIRRLRRFPQITRSPIPRNP